MSYENDTATLQQTSNAWSEREQDSLDWVEMLRSGSRLPADEVLIPEGGIQR